MKTSQERGKMKESDRIKSEIAETRRKMDETIERLGQRLQPRHLADDMVGYIKSHATDRDKAGRALRRIGQQTIRVVSDNPIPIFLISVGIVWILVEHERSGRRVRAFQDEESEFAPPREEAYPAEEILAGAAARHSWEKGSVTQKAGEKFRIGNLARSAKEETMSGMQSVKERISQEGAKGGAPWGQRYESRRERFRRASEGYPLAMGFGFLALGMLAGLALPRGEEEESYGEETSPGLLEKTKQKAEEWMEKGKHAVESVTEGVKKEAEKQGVTPEQMKEKARGMQGAGKQGAADASQKEESPRPPIDPSRQAG